MGTARVSRGKVARDAPTTPSDDALLDACRLGDTEAFTTLFHRYHPAVLRIAAGTSSRFDPEDLTAEAFTRIWAALREGGGPDSSFLPYAKTTVRHVAATWSGRPQEYPAEPEHLELAAGSAESRSLEETLAEHQLVSAAFARLPQRWQHVLWMTEVEGKRAAEVGAALGISPNAAAALSKRAREALGRSWLQAQVDTNGASGDCRWALEHVAGHVRRSLTDQQQNRLRAHLEECQSCDRTVRRIAHLGASLRLVALLAGGSAAGLAAWTVSAATPAFAAGALPASGSGGTTGSGAAAVRSVVKQVARQAMTAQGAIVVGVAAAAVVIAAVVVPGALAGNDNTTQTTGSVVQAVKRAPQILVPPQEPTIPEHQPQQTGTEPPSGLTDNADTAPEAAEEVIALAQRSTIARAPTPKKDRPKTVPPAKGPLPVDPQPEPTEPTEPTTEPTDPPSEPTDRPTEPTDPPSEPSEPTDPPTEPAGPPPEPSGPSCPWWSHWPGWQVDPDLPGWLIDPECLKPPAVPTDPVPPAVPTDPVAPAEPTGPAVPNGPTSSTDPTDPSNQTDPAESTDPVDPAESTGPGAEPAEPEPAAITPQPSADPEPTQPQEPAADSDGSPDGS